MSSIFDTAAAATGWPRYQHIVFDCDSTLSAIEGIDVLAAQPDTRRKVIDLTSAAMNGEVSLGGIYGKRLEMISPTRQAVRALASSYMEHVVADARETVRCLTDAGCEVYIVSGGLLEPVKEFGISLGIAARNIRAVEVAFDQLGGSWWRQDPAEDSNQAYLAYQHGELAESDGKAKIIDQLLVQKSGASLLIGDGVSDLLARNAVDLFVGFGGVESRQKVQQEAPVFFDCESLLPLIPIALGSHDFYRLDHDLRERVVRCLTQSPPRFNRKVLEKHFVNSFL